MKYNYNKLNYKNIKSNVSFRLRRIREGQRKVEYPESPPAEELAHKSTDVSEMEMQIFSMTAIRHSGIEIHSNSCIHVNLSDKKSRHRIVGEVIVAERMQIGLYTVQ